MKPTVELKNYPRELHNFRIRLVVCTAAIFLLFAILFTRFYYLQVVQSNHYYTLAEANRISILPLVPNRGLIFDRNGEKLAENFSAYTLEIKPSEVPDIDASLDELATIIKISPGDRKRFKKLLNENKRFKSLPIRTRLSDKELARFAANRFRFPGIEINAGVLRYYPYGEKLSHVLGYISRINDKDLDQLESDKRLDNYRGSQHIGRIGIEQSYEQILHGTTGFEEVEIDAAGRTVRVISNVPPVPGNNLTLSLDIGLQQAAIDAFGDRRGALVAIDPRSGEILAFVSLPSFDANLFIGGIDYESWDLLNNDEYRPLNNRALRGLYPPASTFKPFMALAALELGERSSEEKMYDTGYFSFPGGKRRYRDWKPGGHGMVDLHKSLVVSCDTYYYYLANDLGINNIAQFIGQFGLGKKTGIDISGEAGGLLPTPEWKMNRYEQRWYPGDTISVGIGQGYNLTTPLQLAFATSILANGGQVFPPHFIKRIENNKTNDIEETNRTPDYNLAIKAENFELIHNALVDVMRPGGTGEKAGEDLAYTFAGKTGTSQVINIKQGKRYIEDDVPERFRDHALFIGYAPAEEPTIALSIIVENGGAGGAVAAPIARQVMDYYLLGRLPDNEAGMAVTYLTEENGHAHHNHP